jgi:hypothetical protein
MISRKTFVLLCFVFLLSSPLLVLSEAAKAEKKQKKFNVVWTDPEATWKEKAVELSALLNEHLNAAGGSVDTLLKDKAGVDLGKTFSTLKERLGFKDKDTRGTMEKFNDLASKVQKSLEDNVFGKVKEMGASMIKTPGEDPKVKAEREKKVEEIVANIASGEAVAKLSLELQEGLISALKEASPDAETVKANLAKAKKGVDQISLWAEELYKNGVSIEKIKELLAEAGLTPMEEEQERNARADDTHEEL